MELYFPCQDEEMVMTMLWQCIYRRKPATLSGANELINRYIHFYNHERIQLKTGEAPLTLRLAA